MRVRLYLSGVVSVLAVCLAVCLALLVPLAAADVRQFARECSALDQSPEDVVRFCSLALDTRKLGPKGMAQTLVNRGVAYASLDRPKKALADYDRAGALAPDLFEIWPNRGATLLRLGDAVGAFHSYSRALSMAPQDRISLIGRGAALVAGGAPDRALADLNAAIALDPEDPTALYNRGLAYAALGDKLRASADFSEVIALAPRDVDARLQRGQLRERRFGAGALEDYAAAISNDPEDPRPYYRRGRLLDALGEVQAANDDFQRAWRLGYRDEWLHERIIALGG